MIGSPPRSSSGPDIATPPPLRALAYALIGWATDRAFTSLTSSLRSREPRLAPPRLTLLPFYGLLLPLYEPVHDRLRDAPLGVRAMTYGLGIVGVEFVSGLLVRRVLGEAPWDYRGARWSVDGLTRLDYLPLWALAGLVLERVHHRLTRWSGSR